MNFLFQVNESFPKYVKKQTNLTGTSLVTYLQSVYYIWLELELELNPKTVAGIGINSIFCF